jgi:hypothetical protein
VNYRAGRLGEIPPESRGVFANGISVCLAGQQLWIIDGTSGAVACAGEATGRILVAVRSADIRVGDLARLGPGWLALPISGDARCGRLLGG